MTQGSRDLTCEQTLLSSLYIGMDVHLDLLRLHVSMNLITVAVVVSGGGFGGRYAILCSSVARKEDTGGWCARAKGGEASDLGAGGGQTILTLSLVSLQILHATVGL